MNIRICQNMIFGFIAFLTVSTSPPLPTLPASEVLDDTKTRVIIREHPKTGKPYVSIVSTDISEPPDPFTGQRGRIIRPDYRMLDPKVKSGQIPYEGPVSDRTRVYIFAATLMTVGTVGGAMIWAAAPAATGAGASSGAGAFLAGGTAVTAGSAAAYSIAAAPDPKKEDYSHTSEYQLAQSLRGAAQGGDEAISEHEIASATTGLPPRND